MKLNKIYVGGRLSLTNGQVAIAVLPASRDQPYNYVLLESGALGKFAGTRVEGVGVPRYLESLGFLLATPEHPTAIVLAELVDVKDGIALLEAATIRQAVSYQGMLAGKTMKVVPFEADKSTYSIQVQAPDGGGRQVCDLVAGLTLGGLKTDYQSGRTNTYTVMNGWLRAETHDEDASHGSPRVTEYGGLVEKACYLLCAAGMALLVGDEHLEDTLEENPDVPFPKGFLQLALMDSAAVTNDVLVVGVTGVDTVTVVYEREGTELYRREGLPDIKLSAVIGLILASVVRVRELDEALAAKNSRVRRRA